MSFRSDQRGQIRVIEALFASLLILSTLALVPSHLAFEQSHYSTLYSQGTQVLISLDNNAMLSSTIEDSNWTSLRNCIQSLLPMSLWFNLTVFDENMNVVNGVFVSNGSPVSEEIIAVNYVCASQSANYAVYVVQLQLAEVS